MGVSIVTVVRNDLSGLLRTYKSVCSLKNRFPNLIQWVVIDGLSTDGTDKWLMSSSLVDYFISEADFGIYHAMWKGVCKSTFDYIWFVNAGDEVNDSFDLIDILNEFNNNDFDLIYCAVKYFGQRDSMIKFPRSPDNCIWHSIPGNQQGIFYRRAVLRDYMFMSAPTICGDYYISCCLHRMHVRFYLHNVVVANFYLGGVSSSRYWKLCTQAWVVQRDILKLPVFIRSISYVRRLFSRLVQHFVLG